MRFFYALLVCFLSLGTLWAQTGYRFRNYSITNGLSQSVVTTIQQDFTHSLWIGTQDGLNRFNGSTFDIFTSDDTEGLESEFILSSGKSKDGRIWFGTNNGLTVYNPYTEKFITYDLKGSTPLHIDDIFIDKYNRIFCASSTHGVLVFNPVLKKFEGLPKPPELIHAQHILVLNSSELLVSTMENGLYHWNIDTRKLTDIKRDQFKDYFEVNKMVVIGQNRIFLATNQGIFQYNAKEKSLEKSFVNIDKKYGVQNVTDIYTEEGTWYITTSKNGLYTVRNDGSVFNSSQDVFQKYALLFNEINIIFKDHFGTFWLGTERGLSNFDPKNQGLYGVGPVADLKQGLANPDVWCFGEDAEANYLFIGTSNSVSRYDRSAGRFDHFYRDTKKLTEKERKDAAVFSMYVIDANRILIGAGDGFYELNIQSANNYTFTPLFADRKNFPLMSKIYSIAYWKEKKFLLGTRGGVILYDLGSKEYEIFKHDPKNRANTIVSGACRISYRDKNGKMWFATSGGGLNYLKETEEGVKIVPYERNDILSKFSKDYITSILQTSTNEYWLGTVGSGILRHNTKNRKTDAYDKNKGLPNSFIYGALMDRDGYLWISTNRGLCRLDPRNGNTRNYTEVDGLMSNEMNLGAYMRSVDGRMYFGGIYGFNYFDPRTLSYNRPEVEVKFSKFRIDGDWITPRDKNEVIKKSISLTDELILNYKQRTFTVQFQASDLSNPEQIYYKYALEGSDEGEVYLGNNNELRFNLLSYGTYTLKVYGKKGLGDWSTKPATMKIKVVPPFWLRWWFFLMLAVVIAIVVAYYIRYRLDEQRREQVRLEMKIQERTREIREQSKKIEKQKAQIEKERNKVVEQQALLQIEKDKSEKLLNNMIPQDTADELKRKGRANARAYRRVTVMFTDFVGFTKISDVMRPTELVQKLDYFFTQFDEIIEKNNIEKIKTIGDAYMAAGGVPVRNNTNPIEACLAGLQIQSFMRRYREEYKDLDEHIWDLRLGINTGEVTAGVIGSKRFAYDVWGATVNQAQRMEMMGEAGKVTITGATYRYIVPYFETTFKGKVKSKSRGMLDMYTVDRIKPELSLDEEGNYPNEKFRKIFDLHMYSSINYYKAERHIMRILEKGLSDNLYYHCIEHTRDVVRAAESIAIQEGVTDEGLYLLKSAATYHDAGFVEDYDKNEPIGARMAEEILPKYGYTAEQIETVKELIYVTEIPHKPKNHLEEIMCDADLDYLGRDDFHPIADRLRQELREHNKINSDRQWDEIQVQFLTNHQYFTETSKRKRQAKKMQNLQEIKERLKRNEYKD